MLELIHRVKHYLHPIKTESIVNHNEIDLTASMLKRSDLDIEKATGVTRQTVHGIRTGRVKNPTARSLQRILDYLYGEIEKRTRTKHCIYLMRFIYRDEELIKVGRTMRPEQRSLTLWRDYAVQGATISSMEYLFCEGSYRRVCKVETYIKELLKENRKPGLRGVFSGGGSEIFTHITDTQREQIDLIIRETRAGRYSKNPAL